VKCRREVFVIAAALLAAGTLPLAAQEPVQAPDTTVQGYAPAAPAPAPAPAPPSAAAVVSATAGQTVAEALGFIDVIPSRSTERIQTELDAAKAASLEADARIGETSSQRSQTKALIQAKKQEISSADARIKLAKKEKQEADKTTLEAEKKVVERQKEFLERREALHGSEIDQAKAAKKLAEARRQALELELQLAGRRADRAAVAGADPTTTLRHDMVIRELERKTLEAQRDEAEAAKDLASRDQDIAKRRLELYQAQMVAGGNAR
jgi:hypothetical protein